MPPNRKRTAGEPLRISAQEMNAWIDAADDYSERRRLGTGGPVRENRVRHATCKVKNSSGSALRRGDVLELDDSLIDTLEPDYMWFDGITPANPGKTLGILRRSVDANDIEEAVLTGVVLAYVDIQDTTDPRAKVDIGENQLISGWGGPFRILDVPPSTGEQLVAVVAGDNARCWVSKVTTAVTARSGDTPGSGVVTLRARDGGSDLTDVKTGVDVLNWTGVALSVDDYVWIEEDAEGDLWVSAADCPAS